MPRKAGPPKGYDPTSIGDLALFGKRLIASKDVDPAYPVLRALYDQRRLNREQELWQTALYLAYYSLPSAITAFRLFPEWRTFRVVPQLLKLTFAVERRGFRATERLEQHLRDLHSRFEAAGSIKAWTQTGWTDWPEHNYEAFWKQSQAVYGNGRWAAFKWGELIKKVHCFNIAAPDMRLEHCSGPKAGLCELYGLDEATPVPTLNTFAQNCRDRLRGMGLEVADWEELETVLCNFHSHCQGKYEVGHDIHEMGEAIEKATWLHPADMAALYEARAAALPHSYLKERQH